MFYLNTRSDFDLGTPRLAVNTIDRASLNIIINLITFLNIIVSQNVLDNYLIGIRWIL